jgi:hypothetical protein
MDPLNFLPRLQQLRDQLLQGQQAGAIDPELVERLKALTAEMKGALQKATAEMHAQAEASGAALLARAEAIEAKQEAAEAPAPAPPPPWEEHQGLTHEAMADLVAATLKAAAARPR